jgi:glycosyltransferase involved in cell wall biosynthesis
MGMRVCYFGGYDWDHPRNRVMISGLTRCGAGVVECHSRHPVKAIRALSLIARYWHIRRHVDLIVVGASCHAYVPLAWALSRLTRKPLVFDAFVSVFETWAEESRRSGPYNVRGRCAYLLDKVGACLSDIVLLDTEEHAAYFCENFALPEAKVRWVQVGAYYDAFVPRERDRALPFQVLFAGSFLPLHGVDVVVRAADLLGGEPDIVIELIGGGDERPRAERSCRSPKVVFREPVPYPQYARLLSRADVALGVFGVTRKAARVIPCKVYDALAAGVPVITADTPAVRRLLRHGHNAILVPPGDAHALADGILLLRKDPALRAHLAREGRRTFEEVGIPEVVGRKLLSICAAALDQAAAGRAGRTPEAK